MAPGFRLDFNAGCPGGGRNRHLTARRLASVLRDAAIVAAVSLAIIAVVELGLRLLYPQDLVPTPVSGDRFNLPDRQLGMRYAPGAVWRFRHPEYEVEYAINADGLRQRTGSAPSATGDPRALLLGDSFTFGQGVAYEETWGAVAEGSLRRSGYQLELINAAVQGMDTRSELLLLRELAPRYRPSVVILGFLISDLYTNRPLDGGDRSTATAKPERAPQRDHLFVRIGRSQTFHSLQLARRLVTSNEALYRKLYLAAPDRGGFLRQPLSPRAARQLAVTADLLRQLAQECRELGVPLVVVSIPQQFQVLYRSAGELRSDVDVGFYDERFAEIARGERFAWIATLDALVESGRSPRDLYYRLDGHLTAAGHEVVGRLVADTLPSLLQQ